MRVDSGSGRHSTIPPSVIGLTVPDRPPVVLELVHPLTKEVTRVEAPEGATIAELLAAAGVNYRRWGAGFCWVEDSERKHRAHVLDRSLWARARPKSGTITTVSLWPGRGSGGGKNILGVILSLALVAAAAIAGPLIAGAIPGLTATQAAAVGAVISTGIPIMGALAINARTPPRARLQIATDR